MTAANLRDRVRFGRRAGPVAAAACSGLLLSAAFPPLDLAWLAWFAFVPLLLSRVPATWRARIAVGAAFGAAHFLTCLAWLNVIGYGAGVLLGLACTVFPLCWYLLVSAAWPAARRAVERGRDRSLLAGPGQWRQAAMVPILAATWVGFEWTRSWVLTGFPWNLAGVTQWRQPALLGVTAYTGVYGLSFAVLAANAGAALLLLRWWRRSRRAPAPPPAVPWPAAVAALPLAACLLASRAAPEPRAPDAWLRMLAVQGDIPQCRDWSEAQLEYALAVYTRLTAAAVPATAPHVVVWPETAVPAPLFWNQTYHDGIRRLLQAAPVPLLVGTLDYRRGPAEPGAAAESPEHSFNSAVYLGADGRVLDLYDKTHLVPFGEYTPLESLWPWLSEWIGMGRSLTRGSEYTVIALPQQARAGVNICYEDVFPGISREFVLRGANLLVTLTNDAWYEQSAGPRQHLIHAVFRAAENRRPLLRVGNNSDTCLIRADGRVTGLLADPVTGHRFVRGVRVYEVPIVNRPGLTVYARWGDWFARSCALATAVFAALAFTHWFRRKARWWRRITGAGTGPG